MSKPAFFRIALVLLLTALAACSGAKPASNQPVTVTITADDFSFKSSLTTFTVGVPYHFVVTNNGKVPHEIMLVQPIEAGKMDMEAMDQMALAHIEEDDLQPGTTQSFDYTFTEAAPAGQLEFSCHIPGHYEAGMKLPITVK
jgi:uncharacterized cupredoxin-like copper-binding protein